MVPSSTCSLAPAAMILWPLLLAQQFVILAAGGLESLSEVSAVAARGGSVLEPAPAPKFDGGAAWAAKCPQFSQSNIQERGPMLAKVEMVRAEGLPKSGTDTPDPYVNYTLGIGSVMEQAFSSTIPSSVDPIWDFSCEFPVPEADGGFDLEAEVWDRNRSVYEVSKKIGNISLKAGYSVTSGPFFLPLDCNPKCPSAIVLLRISWINTLAPPSDVDRGRDAEGGGFPWILVAILGTIIAFGLAASMCGTAKSSGAFVFTGASEPGAEMSNAQR